MQLELSLSLAAMAMSLMTMGVGVGLFRGKMRALTDCLDHVAGVIEVHTSKQAALTEAVAGMIRLVGEMRRDHDRGTQDHDTAHAAILDILQKMQTADAVLATQIGALSD